MADLKRWPENKNISRPLPAFARKGLRTSGCSRPKDPKMQENERGKIVVDAAVKVHSALGPGLLGSVYEAVLAKELE
jgi:hypothetical protein